MINTNSAYKDKEFYSKPACLEICFHFYPVCVFLSILCTFVLMKIIKKHIAQIKELCASHSIKSLFAFGSVTNDQFNDNSDVDLIVDIDAKDPLEYADKYFDLKFNLERLLNRKIDLLEQRAIKNPYLIEEINKTKVLVYGK